MGPIESNHAHALRVANGFKAGVGVEFREDVFDVIVHRCRADVELIGNVSSAVPLGQTLQHFHFSRRQACIDLFVTIPRLRPYKFTQRLFESLPELDWPNNVNRITCSRTRVARDQCREITPELSAAGLNSQIEIRSHPVIHRRALDNAELGTNWTVIIPALENLMTRNINDLCFAESKQFSRGVVPGADSSRRINCKRRIRRPVHQQKKTLQTHAYSPN